MPLYLGFIGGKRLGQYGSLYGFNWVYIKTLSSEPQELPPQGVSPGTPPIICCGTIKDVKKQLDVDIGRGIYLGLVTMFDNYIGKVMEEWLCRSMEVCNYCSWCQVELTSTWNPHTPCIHDYVNTETYPRLE